MANNCINHLQVKKSENSEFIKWFSSQTGESGGCLPDFCINKEKGNRYLFDIDVTDDAVGFWSKWAPPIEELVEMGKFWKTSFELNYAELGNGIFGRFTFDHLTYKQLDVYLNDAELEQVEFDGNGEPFYKGERIESEYEIYQQLLEKK